MPRLPSRAPHSLVATLLLLLAVTIANAAEPASPIETLLTSDTVGFAHFRVADIWANPKLAFYRNAIEGLGMDELKAFNGKFSPSPSEYETLTIIMPSINVQSDFPDGRPVGESLLWVITTKKPIDKAQLIKSLGKDGQTKTYHEKEYLFEESHWAGLLLLDPSTLVLGSEDSILWCIDVLGRKQQDSSVLAKIFAAEAAKHSAILGFNPAPVAATDLPKQLPQTLMPLVKTKSLWAALDLKQETTISLTMDFADAEQMAAGLKGMETLREMALLKLQEIYQDQQKNQGKVSPAHVHSPLMFLEFVRPFLGKATIQHVITSLKNVKFVTKEGSFSTTINLHEVIPGNVDLLLIGGFLGIAVEEGMYWTSESSQLDRDIPYRIKESFERIASALEAYHKDKGNYPPQAIYDKNGKALLSWRVLILPYLEQRPGEDFRDRGRINGAVETRPIEKKPINDEKKTYADLYQLFKLDEPWDSLHNKKLIQKMPHVYAINFCVNRGRLVLGKTGVQVFHGPGSMFPDKGTVSKGQIRDGLDSTIAMIFRDDFQNGVIWSKPADIPFQADKKLPGLTYIEENERYGRQQPTAVCVLMADGKTLSIPADFDEKQFRGLITINGGETIKLPEQKKSRYPKKDFFPDKKFPK